MKYYYLKKGEIIQAGDEVEMSAKYNDPEKWQQASENSIGTPAPDPSFMAHRVYRRRIKFYVGQQVLYVPHHAQGDRSHPHCQRGIVSTVKDQPNGLQKVWVRYSTGETGALTDTDNLVGQ